MYLLYALVIKLLRTVPKTTVILPPTRCHFGDCPPCKQTCARQMSCGHSCPAPCHDRVKVVSGGGAKASVPWEETGPRLEVKALSCPDCMHPVPVTCLGAHETADWPCHAAKVRILKIDACVFAE